MTEMTARRPAPLAAEALTIAYGAKPILDGLTLSIPEGRVTAIIGPNACGKSTLLRSLARLLRPKAGQVLLDGKAIHKLPTRDVARQLAILPQSPLAPEGLTVQGLVLRGRTPHQSPLRQWTARDAEAVAQALALTGLADLADRPVEALSGGQRQRAWIAMALAQETGILLLDEPTTYLDLPHQIEVLALVRKLNRDHGRTVVLVLHDVNLAARFSDHIIAMRGGRILRHGPPQEIISADTMSAVYGLDCTVIADPHHGTPHVIPA